MPPTLASVLTIGFIIWLFRRDLREKPNVTGALWIPVFWMVIIASRSVSQWFGVFGLPTIGGSSFEEGTPIDAIFYFGMIIAGIHVLIKRHVSVSEIVRNNVWLAAFFIYCFISIIWSDFPFVAFKHWIKIIGFPIICLVVLTEPDPDEALKRLMKRCAYVVLPVSILFIKYYEDLGRAYDDWTGLPVNTGITTGKNELGTDCLILGFFFFWHLLNTWHGEKGKARRNELLLCAGFLYMVGWLFWKAHSATSFLAFMLGVVIVTLLGFSFVNKRYIGTYVISIALVLVVAELAFGLSEHVVNLTGHNDTLEGRGFLWNDLLAMHTNPIVGVGFESFWMGDRLKQLWATRWWHPNEAHNGYLEIYLNLGVVGLFFLAGLIIATFLKIGRVLLSNLEWGQFRLGFLAITVVHNWTESDFKGLSLVGFVFYLIAMDYPALQLIPASRSTGAGLVEEEPEPKLATARG